MLIVSPKLPKTLLTIKVSFYFTLTDINALDFILRRKILDRACKVIRRLKVMRYTATIEDLFDVHRKIQNVDFPIEEIYQINQGSHETS